ncbi:hypothetical protein [Mycobacterium sp. 94-17]|nr:hypothetical protein [Mycobacterium sp. 94-17]MEB4210961.1 hypothetical protein [Mycobacterium sp. 94-17]
MDDPDGGFGVGDLVPVVSVLGVEGARRWQWIADRIRVRSVR